MKELSLVIGAGVQGRKTGVGVVREAIEGVLVLAYVGIDCQSVVWADWVVQRRESSVGVCVRIILSNLTEGIQVYEY